MTDESNKRIGLIGKMQKALADKVQKAESRLYELILENWKEIRSKPAYLQRAWNIFQVETYEPLFSRFASDIKTIPDLNMSYFAQEATNGRLKEIADTVNSALDERLGIEATGKLTNGGYLDTLVKDQTAKRNVQQLMYRTRALKNETQVKQTLKELVKGVKQEGGEISKFFDNHVYDTYQESDRLAQNTFADKLELPAAIYVGGLIDGTRPFCLARNRKIFLREEIALFGTSEDAFGGYSNKATGMFSGKPKNGYDPFTQCGGHRCRHHLSWVNKFYAVRLEPEEFTLQNGVLVRI